MNQCIECGSTNLDYIDTDREEIDETLEIERVVYQCGDCATKQMDVTEIETSYKPLGMRPYKNRWEK